jgi:hypothetical protein
MVERSLSGIFETTNCLDDFSTDAISTYRCISKAFEIWFEFLNRPDRPELKTRL